MKDFVIHDFNKFLDIADGIRTPFKFIEIDEISEVEVRLEAKIWLRTAYISYRENFNLSIEYQKKKYESLIQTLKTHEFCRASIEETPLVVR